MKLLTVAGASVRACRARLVKHLPFPAGQPHRCLRILCRRVGQEASHGKQGTALSGADGPDTLYMVL